ncbi:nucleoside deaminase [Streptomyces sp. NPDC056470]|uniref:nucleoside deaminase n=1 Tax=Streptomyces sp. NPDC056470 TaxID=3345831 RepID=UPI0036AE2771
MRRAIELGMNVPSFPFGALIVDRRSADVLAEGWQKDNPICHGEIDALNALAKAHAGIDGTDLLLYTTAEPCPMCQSATLWAGIGTVIFGTSIEYLKNRGWWQIAITSAEIVRQADFRHCTLIGGVLERECNALFESGQPSDRR